MAGTKPLYHILEQVYANLIAEKNEQGGKKDHHPNPAPVLPPQKIEEQGINRDPDKFVTGPPHHEVEEITAGFVQDQEQAAVP